MIHYLLSLLHQPKIEMKFLRIAVLALLCQIAFIVGDATSSPSSSAEEYWHSILPHTPIPKNLNYLLSGIMNEEIAETKYPYANFFEEDLHEVGKQMNIKFNVTSQPAGFNGLWDRNKMGKDPTKNLTVEEICNDQKLLGEDSKFCAESIESLLDFVVSKLGNDNKDNIQALAGSFVARQTRYKILEGVRRVSSEESSVMCHKPNSDGNKKKKLVFYCHQVNATKAYTVPMEAADGTRTTAVAVCHHDTRGLDPHILLHELRVVPGTVPVCHFMGSEAITWTLRNNNAAY